MYTAITNVIVDYKITQSLRLKIHIVEIL